MQRRTRRCSRWRTVWRTAPDAVARVPSSGSTAEGTTGSIASRRPTAGHSFSSAIFPTRAIRATRLAAEWGFLEHAWSRGVRNVPEPVACNPESHTGLYGFVPGRKLDTSEIGLHHVDAAIDFVLAVNAPPRTPRALASGSEACFSMAEHVSTVERRVARLGALDPAAPHLDAASRFVAGVLFPTWAVSDGITWLGTPELLGCPTIACWRRTNAACHRRISAFTTPSRMKTGV